MKRATILILLICFIFLSACETKELASEVTSDQINDVQGQKDELNIGVADLPEKFDGTFSPMQYILTQVLCLQVQMKT